MKKGILLTLGLALAMTSCSSKEDMGTLVGGAGGALVGSQFGQGGGRVAMIAAGTLLGAFIGNRVGNSLDKADLMYAQQATNKALEYTPGGQAVAWNNPDSGHYGSITPIRTYQVADQYCREYQQTVVVGGQQQSAYGKACRQPDGSWKIVN